MRKKKGAALVTAILLSGIFLLVTLGVTGIIINNAYYNKYVSTKHELELTYRRVHEQFIGYIISNNHQASDAATINGDETFIAIDSGVFTHTCYCSDGASAGTYLKALVLKDSSDKINFYSVIEFNTTNVNSYVVRAFQTSDKYIEGNSLAGIVPMGE